LVACVRANPVAPTVSAAYTELVEAIFADNLAVAIRIANEICAPDFGHTSGLRVIRLDDDDLGPGQSARFRRLVDDDPEVGRDLRDLSARAFADAFAAATEALALLEAAAPELSGEVRALIREIILVETPAATFGASSFQIWGALFLDVKPYSNRVEIAEAIVHETSHTLLFGLGMGKPLVENADEDRFPSPLRTDLRPMDGVVHASFVLARMHYTVTRLLRSGLLTPDEGRLREKR
jgi:HEXXH motif-containing protein